MFFTRKKPEPEVLAGALFGRSHRGNLEERAEVLRITEHEDGIPHVHFRLCYRRPGRFDILGDRMLAKESFLGRYSLIEAPDEGAASAAA